MMGRMGIPVEGISARLNINRKTAKKYSENPGFIQSIKKSLKKGHSCHKVAEKHACPVGPEDRTGGCPEPLVWSIALEGKSDLDRFKALNWGLRTWDLWPWNDCLPREIFTPLNLPFLFNLRVQSSQRSFLISPPFAKGDLGGFQ